MVPTVSSLEPPSLGTVYKKGSDGISDYIGTGTTEVSNLLTVVNMRRCQVRVYGRLLSFVQS